MPAKKSKPEASTERKPSGSVSGLPLAVGSVALQAWMELGTEAMRFVWDRLQQDMKTQQAILACTSLEELRKIQTEFFTAAREQYASEAGKVLDLLGKTTAEGLSASGLKRRYDDVPL